MPRRRSRRSSPVNLGRKWRRDQYGRTLAYVWAGNRMLNEELVRAGLARAERQYSYSAERKARFLEAQPEAQAARRGLWSQP